MLWAIFSLLEMVPLFLFPLKIIQHRHSEENCECQGMSGNSTSPIIIYSLISTLLLLSANMAINDLFDLEIDRINHSDRPLVSGEIKIKEAILLTIALIFSTELINIFLLPQKLQIPIHLSVLFTFIYTPILKKILFVKNISCALMVAYSIFFGGFAAYNNFSLFEYK